MKQILIFNESNNTVTLVKQNTSLRKRVCPCPSLPGTAGFTPMRPFGSLSTLTRVPGNHAPLQGQPSTSLVISSEENGANETRERFHPQKKTLMSFQNTSLFIKTKTVLTCEEYFQMLKPGTGKPERSEYPCFHCCLHSVKGTWTG